MKSTSKTLFTLTLLFALTASVFLAGCAADTPPAFQSAPAGDVSADAGETATPEAVRETDISYVSIDINPSIELTLQDGKVIGARAYNDDGAAIILVCNVIGMTPQEAVAALVNEFAAQGFITEDTTGTPIVITVAGGQEAGLAESLKQGAQACLDGLGFSCGVYATNVAEEIVHTAENCGLSVGKYLLLKQIVMQEHISFKEAKDKYGALKMGELLAMIEDIDSFMGDVQQLSSVLDSLTPEQLQMLYMAQETFRVAMRSAQEAFLLARTQARETFQAARDAAKESFLETKDNEALKAVKQQVKDAFALAKKTATDTLKQAKIQARAAFVATVEGLGLDKETIEELLEWDFDMSFDVDMEFDVDEKTDQEDEDQENGSNKKDDQGKGGQGNGQKNDAHMGDGEAVDDED